MDSKPPNSTGKIYAATVGRRARREPKLVLKSQTVWRLARETERLVLSSPSRLKKRKINRIILDLLTQATGLTETEILKETKYISLRADINSLAFPPDGLRDEVFAAIKAGRPLPEILWISRGKPKDERQKKWVIGQFQKTLRGALQTQYTDDELRQLFEIALNKL